MKHILYIILGLIVCTSCEDVIDIDIPSGDPRLVIDASFEIYLDEERHYLLLFLMTKFLQ